MGGNASLLYTAVSVDFLLLMLLKVRADSDLHSGVRLEAIGEMRSGDRHSQYDGERGLSCERGLCCERDVTVSDTRYVKMGMQVEVKTRECPDLALHKAQEGTVRDESLFDE